MIRRNGRAGPAGSLVSMQSSDTHSSLEPTAPGRRSLAWAHWRLLWGVPTAGWVLTLPESPATWPALGLLAASTLVLHADPIARPILRRGGRSLQGGNS